MRVTLVMAKNLFVFTKEMGNLLVNIRNKARLSQNEVAEAIGMSSKLGHSYISRLENGKIKNPFLGTIILYLDACHTPYLNFFAKFSELRFREQHQEIMLQAKLPKDTRTRTKIDRDTALYSNKIKYQTKTPYLDIDKLKAKINRMLDQYMSDHKIDKHLIPIYQDFTSYVLKRVLNPKPNPPLDFKPWIKSSVQTNQLYYINQMIYKIVHQEEKKLNRRRIPTTEKQKKMVIGFLKYRVMIEQVETETHKLLNELEVPFSQYHLYKDFARECFSHLKKLYFKDQMLLSQRFAQSIRGWKEAKLDKNVLEKVKEVTIKVFQTLFASPIQK